MYYYCHYLKRSGDVKQITLDDMKYYEEHDLEEHDYIAGHLFRTKKLTIKMEYVRQVEHPFFRKSNKKGNKSHKSRGEAESFTHQIHVDAISDLKEFTINVYGNEVKLFIKDYELDKTVYCNGNSYEVDIYFELEKTEPAEYYDYLKGVLYFEVYHTCKVDWKQAEDFATENLPLYEYKISKKYSIPNKINGEYINNRIANFKEYLKKNSLKGYPIYFPQEINKNRWIANEKGNRVCKIDGTTFTIFIKDHNWYLSIKENEKNVRFVDGFEYNEKDLESAIKRADYIIFREYNDYKQY